jgi:hypothetical protein
MSRLERHINGSSWTGGLTRRKVKTLGKDPAVAKQHKKVSVVLIRTTHFDADGKQCQ